jgi:hypothetical protein
VLIEGLAEKSFNHSLTTDVQLSCGLIQLAQHRGGEINVHPLHGLVHFSDVRKDRDTSSPLSAMRSIDSADGIFFFSLVRFI